MSPTCSLMLGLTLLLAEEAGTTEFQWLGESPEIVAQSSQDWGILGFNTCTFQAGNTPLPLRISDVTYDRGLGTHAKSEIVVLLARRYLTFQAEIGIQSGNPTGSVVFQVYVDDERVFDSGIVRHGQAAIPVHVPVAAGYEMRLVVTDAGDGIECDAANWANARLEIDPDAPPLETGVLDVAPFARVVTSDPARVDGARTSRLEEFHSEDVFLEQEILPDPDGFFEIPVWHGTTCCIGLQWPERRIIREISLEFADAARMPGPQDLRIEYWSSEGRSDEWAVIGQTLWQGKWVPMPGEFRSEGQTWTLQIPGDLPEYMPRFGIQKVRWVMPAVAGMRVRTPVAISDARSRTARYRLELEAPRPGEQAAVEVYNGFFLGSGTEKTARQITWDLNAPLAFDLRHVVVPAFPDRTVLRIGLPESSFGIAIADVIKHGCVYVKESGLFMTADPPDITLADHQASIADAKTILERVREMPDQTFDRAKEVLFNPLSNHDPMLLGLACDNEKLVVEREGTIQFADVPFAADPSRMPYLMSPRFGSGAHDDLTRELVDQWFPIPAITVRERGITYVQRCFAIPYDDTPHPELPDWLNAQPLVVAEFVIENRGADASEASLKLDFVQRVWEERSLAATEPLADLEIVPQGALVVRAGRLLAYVDASSCAPLSPSTNGSSVTLSGALPGGGTACCRVYFPRWPVDPADYARIRNGADLLSEAKAYWRGAMRSAMRIDVPEPLVNNVFRANQAHLMLATRHEDGGRKLVPWIGAVIYGPLDTEAQPVIWAMDLLGHHEFARRAHDYFLGRYHPNGYLANGYTLMGTGQHLWTIGEHHKLTRDAPWLKEIAPHLEKTCRWIAEQREKTKRLDPCGEKVPEYGMVPPGVLADWERYAYYFYANGYYCAGMRAVGELLADIGHTRADWVTTEAEAYRRDILRAFRWNQARMPVLPLRDGTWIPSYPSSIYCFGLTREFYKGVSSVGHDVEVGSNHLLGLGILDPAGPDGERITNYMEDEWFFHEPNLAEYSRDVMEADWFTYGGFAKLQPYYTRYSDVLALRDDVKPFIRNYFNTFFPMLSLETLALWEHFNCLGAWNKTHETAWLLEQTRMSLVMERGGELWLAPLVTCNWLRDGMRVSIANAPTYFGAVSYQITSHVRDGYIEARIDPPTRDAPDAIVLRIRHPESLPIRSVIVNDEVHTDVNRENDTIRISPGPGPITVRANYRS